jgi:mono/diheme cytochrome c family protein
MRLIGLLVAGAAALTAADPAAIERGRAEEKRSCTACHGLRISHSQRLSRAVWDRELTKMTGWGATIGDREALLEYLVANFGDDKPAPAPVMTGDGSK